MCGIAALINKTDRFLLADHVKEMLKLAQHRGPNGQGVLSDEGIALGHLRLSIIDLSDDASQPMQLGDRFVITYNGEVYNYLELRRELELSGVVFKSHSDTEVILAAFERWGPDCLHRFNGMFAFVIWDRKKRKAFIARDRFGVKPLYYWRAPDQTLAFASEIKQFTCLPGWSARLNHQRGYDFLNWSLTDHTPETLFEGVLQIPPGYCAEIDVDVSHDLRLNQWYKLTPAKMSAASPLGYCENLFELLTDSVRLRLRSDVPVGSCLSGGLDSTSIVAIMNGLLRDSGHADKQKTFSAVFPGDPIDESPAIDETARMLGIENFRALPTAESFIDNFEKLIWHQDEPFGSTSIFAQWEVFKTARQNGVTVMLDGQGSDEQLAGYHVFFGSHLLGLFKSGALATFAREMSAIHREHGYGRKMLLLKTLNRALPGPIRQIGRRLTGRTLPAPQWLNSAVIRATPRDPWDFENGHPQSTQELSHALLTSLNLQMLLHFEDRNSMAHSIEARVPFLDYRVVEFSLGLPDTLKIRNGITKWALREAVKGRIPESIREQRRKIGFEAPESRWFANPPKALANDYQRAIQRAESYAKLSEPKFGPLNFRVYCFEKWRERFNVQL